jgi:hypothetical protein
VSEDNSEVNVMNRRVEKKRKYLDSMKKRSSIIEKDKKYFNIDFYKEKS